MSGVDSTASLGRDKFIIGGNPAVKPKRRNCLRDPNWTEITDRDFARNPDWYIETGTLRVNDELITFWDFTF